MGYKNTFYSNLKILDKSIARLRAITDEGFNDLNPSNTHEFIMEISRARHELDIMLSVAIEQLVR